MEPLAPTGFTLSGGDTVPFVYSLGVNSTVPYVRVLTEGSQKIFSWGEPIVVQPRVNATIVNASYHPGDIFIQSGSDPGAIPARVTIPVGLKYQNVAHTVLEGRFPVDVRRARRAFVAGFAVSTNAFKSFVVVAFARDRSHTITPAFAFGPPITAIYAWVQRIPPNTFMGLMSLGIERNPAGPASGLLDYIKFGYSDTTTRSESGSVYYVLEYT